MRLTKVQLCLIVAATILFTALIILSTGISNNGSGLVEEKLESRPRAVVVQPPLVVPHTAVGSQLPAARIEQQRVRPELEPPITPAKRTHQRPQSGVKSVEQTRLPMSPIRQPQVPITDPLPPASITPKPPAGLTYRTEIPKTQNRTRAATSQEKKMCLVKYPHETMEMLKRTLAVRGVRRVAFVGVVKEAMHVLPSMEEAMLQAIDILSPENVFVSFLESGSPAKDKTPQYLQDFGSRLQKLGVSNVISTGKHRISAVFHPGKEGNRINFLGRLRNAAMFPAMYGYPVGYFDKIFFINDVFICGGDILRLLAHDADIACGLDYGGDSRHIYDSWVIRGWTEQFPEEKSFDPKSTDPTSNVFACWNGGAASRALLWYSGMRFRRGMPELDREDCSQSECSLWAMDAHILGFHNIILDPSVQVGYTWMPYELNFIDSPPHTKVAVDSPNVMSLNLNLSHIPYICCEIEDKAHHIDRRKCNIRHINPPPKGDCDRNPSKCLRYEASRWEEDWDWQSLFQQGANVGTLAR